MRNIVINKIKKKKAIYAVCNNETGIIYITALLYKVYGNIKRYNK